MAYSTAEKLEILNYAKEYGLEATVQTYHVSKATVILWNKKYNIYPVREKRIFSRDEKIAILKQAQKIGLNAAAHKFDIASQSLYQWNKSLRVYNKLSKAGHKRRPHFSPTERREILTYVKEHGLAKAIRKYHIASSTIYAWNNIYHVFETRGIRHFTPQQKQEILQFAAEKSVTHAAYKFDIATHTIRQWQEKQSKHSR